MVTRSFLGIAIALRTIIPIYPECRTLQGVPKSALVARQRVAASRVTSRRALVAGSSPIAPPPRVRIILYHLICDWRRHRTRQCRPCRRCHPHCQRRPHCRRCRQPFPIPCCPTPHGLVLPTAVLTMPVITKRAWTPYLTVHYCATTDLRQCATASRGMLLAAAVTWDATCAPIAPPPIRRVPQCLTHDWRLRARRQLARARSRDALAAS